MVLKVSTAEYNDRQLQRRKEQMLGEAEQEYQASLGRGFSFDGGTWDLTAARERNFAQGLSSRLNANAAGNGPTKLPRGVSTVQFIDNSGTSHDFDSEQIVDFAAAGQDVEHDARNNLMRLRGEIDAASTDADLDAIDPTSGWPN